MHYKKPLQLVAALVSALNLPAIAWANWTLNSDDSSLHYLSTKVTAGATASFTERNGFTRLSGNVTDAGKAEVAIDLTSVETNIPIRNERMREHVFNTNAYPKARLTTQLPADATEPGNRTLDLAIEITMNGHAKMVNVPVHVSANTSRLTVTPTDIVLLNASEFGMTDGLNTLTQLAGLAHIPVTVPVSFELNFDK